MPLVHTHPLKMYSVRNCIMRAVVRLAGSHTSCLSFLRGSSVNMPLELHVFGEFIAVSDISGNYHIGGRFTEKMSNLKFY